MANGATLLKAANDINLGTVTESNSQSNSRNRKNYLRTASSTDVGSQISAQSDLTLSAGHNLNAQAADVTSEQGNLIALAGDDINLTTGEATTQASEGHTSKKSGFLSSTKKNTRSTVDDTTNIATNFSGNQVLLQSGQDINITGSSVVSDNGTTLNAKQH
ncbi:MAG: hemagglutinin repeat-containing protein [Methylotenera sp.]|nr:hemagglutinin repeat-containing protein [Methylotenera sp.]